MCSIKVIFLEHMNTVLFNRNNTINTLGAREKDAVVYLTVVMLIVAYALGCWNCLIILLGLLNWQIYNFSSDNKRAFHLKQFEFENLLISWLSTDLFFKLGSITTPVKNKSRLAKASLSNPLYFSTSPVVVFQFFPFQSYIPDIHRSPGPKLILISNFVVIQKN